MSRETDRNSLLKIGLVGCGEHASDNLIPPLWINPFATVVAVCDVDESSARQCSARFTGATPYSEFHDLLAHPGLDAIVAAAPPQVHFEVAHAALQRGLHVFCEKPPTVTTAELRVLSDLSERHNLVTVVGHNLRHAAASREMQRAIQDRAFGEPICMQMGYLASKPRGDRWNLNSVVKSFLLSHANHAIDFLVFMMGAIDSVSVANVAVANGGFTLAATFQFQRRSVGNLIATTCAPHFAIKAAVVSSENRLLQLDSLHGLTGYGLGEDPKRWGRRWIPRTLDTGYESAGYQNELDLFIQAIRGQGTASPSFREEIAVYEIMDEIERQIV